MDLYLGAEFVFAIMVMYYFVEEMMEIKENKLSYFISFWNNLDIFVILVIPYDYLIDWPSNAKLLIGIFFYQYNETKNIFLNLRNLYVS